MMETKNGIFYWYDFRIIPRFLGGTMFMVSICDSNIALKLSNVMNASMLECVTKQVITKEQVYDIEDIFFKHIEINFKHIKASHSDSCKEKEE